MSLLAWEWILVLGLPSSCPTTSLRPRRPSSSARTRRPLSEAMKFTLWMRSSRSTASRKCLRKIEPLAPVVATVRFWGGWFGNGTPWAIARSSEHREAADGKSRQEPWHRARSTDLYGEPFTLAIATLGRAVACAGGRGTRDPRQ